MIKANLTYLAKLREDPYSNSLLEEIEEKLGKVEQQIMSKAFNDLAPHQVYYLLGAKHAFLEILKIPEEANEELSVLPDAE